MKLTLAKIVEAIEAGYAVLAALRAIQAGETAQTGFTLTYKGDRWDCLLSATRVRNN